MHCLTRVESCKIHIPGNASNEKIFVLFVHLRNNHCALPIHDEHPTTKWMKLGTRLMTKNSKSTGCTRCGTVFPCLKPWWQVLCRPFLQRTRRECSCQDGAGTAAVGDTQLLVQSGASSRGWSRQSLLSGAEGWTEGAGAAQATKWSHCLRTRFQWQKWCSALVSWWINPAVHDKHTQGSTGQLQEAGLTVRIP